MLGSAQIAVAANGLRVVASGDYKNVPDPTCAPFELVPCDVFITEATFALAGVPSRRSRRADRQAPSLGRAVSRARASRRRLFARQGAARDRAAAQGRLCGADLSARRHGEDHRLLCRAAALRSASCARCAAPTKPSSPAPSRICPPSALNDVWTRRFPEPIAAFASGWMRVRARARQHGVELPLVISDHADWDGLTATIAATGAGEIWVTHGQEDALVHWCVTRGLKARPLDIVGYGDEDDDSGEGGGEHEPLRRASRSPRLRARPQQQAAADDRLFPLDARSRARLGARRAHRRAQLHARQARPYPQPDRGAHRPGAVRAVLRLCRRSFRDRRADVAAAACSPPPRGGEAREQATLIPHRRHRNARHPRQGATAAAARALARCARRDRPLGADQARHRRIAHRRLGAAGQSRGRRASAARRRRRSSSLWPGLAPPYVELVCLARRPRRPAGERRSGAVSSADAGACARGQRFSRARPRRVHGRMEVGRHPGAGRRRAARRQDGRPALFAHRRGYLEKLSRPARRIAASRCDRRRAVDHARASRADLQRAAAAAQPQNRHGQAHGGISRASARL